MISLEWVCQNAHYLLITWHFVQHRRFVCDSNERHTHVVSMYWCTRWWLFTSHSPFDSISSYFFFFSHSTSLKNVSFYFCSPTFICHIVFNRCVRKLLMCWSVPFVQSRIFSCIFNFESHCCCWLYPLIVSIIIWKTNAKRTKHFFFLTKTRFSLTLSPGSFLSFQLS